MQTASPDETAVVLRLANAKATPAQRRLPSFSGVSPTHHQHTDTGTHRHTDTHSLSISLTTTSTFLSNRKEIYRFHR